MKAIVAADLHLRDDRPVCRSDPDWMQSQEDALNWLFSQAQSMGVPLILVGDIFDAPRCSPELVNIFIQVANAHSSVKVYGIAGNHDLPYHSWDNAYKSSFGSLWFSGAIQKAPAGIVASHFGAEDFGKPDSKIRLHHELTFETKADFPPMAKAKTAEDLLNEFPDQDWILVGDMHHHFHFQKGRRHVINPGCLIRQTADLVSYQSGVYFIDTEESIVEWIPFFDGDALITDLYLRKEEERVERITAFVSALADSSQVSLSFEDNLQQALINNSAILPAEIPIIIQDLIQRGKEI